MTRVIGMAARAIGAAALAIGAVPAGADVKTGVDAWARGDFPRAVAEWRPLAVTGDADAQFNLGQAYKLGRGVPLDPVQALDWFRRAADQGHVQAQDNYALGLFQANRKAEALPLLERSAARGEPRSQLVLGTMLFNGDGATVDYPRAYALMTRASQAGLSSASQSLAQMDGYITPADRERGLRLAGQYPAPGSATPAAPGRQAVAPRAPDPAPRASAPPIHTAALPPRQQQQPRPAPRAPAPSARPAPAAAPAAAGPAPARGTVRIQLGAFRDRGNAEALWARVRGRMGAAQPAYVAGGGVTRLQATGFATRAAAQRACAAAGVACVVLPS